MAQRGVVDRRTFLGGAAALSAAVAFSRDAAAGSEINMEEATLADLQQGIVSGALTSRALTEACLARINALDRRGPELRSIIEVNPEALAIAEALDAERRVSGGRGPWHPGPAQRQHRHRRSDEDDGRLARPGGFDTAA
jgi:amidase